jgi:ribosomal-protein-alanine N-acetyltransferase
LRSDPAANRFLKDYAHQSEEVTTLYLEKIMAGVAEQYWYYWIIENREGKLPAGSICLWNFSPGRDMAETGFALLPEFKGKGLMSEALASILGFARDELRLHRVEAWTHPENNTSIRLLERSGFLADPDAVSPAGASEMQFYRQL